MKFLVFAGTTEGRLVVEYLLKATVKVTACVATDYGSTMLPNHENLKVNEGRLSVEEMKPIIKDHDLVIDATHPYAEIVTNNIKTACKEVKVKYVRVERPSLKLENVIEVKDTEEAVEILKHTEGNVLITTGSKELHRFTSIPNYKRRLFPRVLPMVSVLEKCSELGFEGKNLICMQGPFTFEINVAMMKQFNVKYMVTKDTGTVGGFEEKVKAAKETGVKIVLIKRPTEVAMGEEAFGIEGLKGYLKEKYGLNYIHNNRKVNDKNIDLQNIEEVNQFSESNFFPLFIDIKDKLVLIVGGGKIAGRRVDTLLKFGARVRVIAPEINEALKVLKEKKLIEVISREYFSHDIDGSFLVVAATNKRGVNCLIGEDAKKRGIFVSVADCKEESNFYFPAVFEDEGVVGGLISKGGRNHSLVRKRAEEIRKCLVKEEKGNSGEKRNNEKKN